MTRGRAALLAGLAAACSVATARRRDTKVRVSALCPGVIDTAIIGTSTMRGEFVARQARTVDLYAKRGTSPDVVARQALAAITRGRAVVPTPRYQVVPHWVIKRVSPRAGRALAVLTT